MNCPKEAPLMSMWLVQLAWINGWCVMNKYISPYTRWSACVSCLFVLPSSGSAAAMVTQQRVVCSGTLRLESQHWRRTTGKRKGFWRNNRSNQFVRFQLLSFLLFSFWNEHSCSVCHRGGWHASSPPFWRFDCRNTESIPTVRVNVGVERAVRIQTMWGCLDSEIWMFIWETIY